MINTNVINAIALRMQARDCCHNPFRLVFWHSDGLDHEELRAYRAAFAERSWELLDAATVGPLALKSRIRDEAGRSFVILITGEQAEARKDPLLDLKLRYPVFRADDQSMYLDELGLGSRMDLRDYVGGRLAFFKKKERRDALKRLGLTAESENRESMDAKLIAAVAGADAPQLEAVILALVSKLGPEDDVNALLAPFDLQAAFWQAVKQAFGFEDATAKLAKLVLRLFYSDLAYSLAESGGGKAAQKLAPYLVGVPSAAFRLCQAWRNTVSARPGYIRWLRWVSASTEGLLSELLNELDLDALLRIRGFDVNKWILAQLVGGLKRQGPVEALRKIAELAQAKAAEEYWLSPDEAAAYPKAYGACEAAAAFTTALASFSADASMGAPAMAEAYVDSWYRIDQHYRLYRERSESLAAWDLFKSLTALLDGYYVGRYLQVLGAAWERALLGEADSLGEWAILPGAKQEDFFLRHVQTPLESGELKRLYVIVSDALRYETAAELADTLAANPRLKLERGAMQSMLPSITRLGMAALLPHRALSLGANQSVLVDGQASQGTENRAKILARHEGAAIDWAELLAMKREAARAFVKDKAVVYIYHDKIDAVGDKQVSEERSFAACREAIQEIANIVQFVMNTLLGSRVVITADHGFIYLPGDPPESMKTALPAAIPGTLEAKKRYLIGRKLAEYPGAIRGALKLDGEASDLGFLIPRGLQRFHFKGGAQFFHGGIMPQETIVPALTVRMAGEGARSAPAIRKVELGVMSLPQTITTRQINPRIHQDEPIGPAILPRTVKIGIYKDRAAVSDEPVVMFNASGDNHADLRRTVPLHLLRGDFDSKALYRFSIVDEESGVEVYGQDLHISLMIADEF